MRGEKRIDPRSYFPVVDEVFRKSGLFNGKKMAEFMGIAQPNLWSHMYKMGFTVAEMELLADGFQAWAIDCLQKANALREIVRRFERGEVPETPNVRWEDRNWTGRRKEKPRTRRRDVEPVPLETSAEAPQDAAEQHADSSSEPSSFDVSEDIATPDPNDVPVPEREQRAVGFNFR